MNSVSLYIGPGPQLSSPALQRQASSAQAARAKEAAFANSPKGRKLRKAAAEFESQLLSSLWKSMKSSFAPDEDDSSDPATQSFADWGINAMCNAVGKAGGLGIGKQIVHALETKMERLGGEASGATTEPFHFGTGVSREASMP